MARRGKAAAYGCAAGVALAAVAEATNVLIGPNFHTVIPRRVFRCSQMSGRSLERWSKQYGIRTVVNLRGFSPPLAWYIEESRVTHHLNLAQEDIAFSASRLPPSQEFRRLIEVIDRAEYPLLLHCRQGADRTGLASAVAILLQPGSTLAEARRQLSPRYGHFSLDRARFLDHFLDLYEAWLHARGSSHSSEQFRRWVAEPNFPGECRGFLELRDVPARIRAGEPFEVRVRVRNDGTEAWHFQPGSLAGHHLVFVVRNAADELITSGRAGLLNAEVPPGHERTIAVVVPALKKPGVYRLFVDLTDEQHCWFSQVGSEPLEFEVEVHE